jgi:hypothetical protein
LKIAVNKLNIKVSATFDTANLISLNDCSEEYLKRIPDVHLLYHSKTFITKHILLPVNADISFVKARLVDDMLMVMIPKLEDLELLPDETVDIEDA